MELQVGDIYDDYGDISVENTRARIQQAVMGNASQLAVEMERLEELCRAVPREWRSLLWDR